VRQGLLLLLLPAHPRTMLQSLAAALPTQQQQLLLLVVMAVVVAVAAAGTRCHSAAATPLLPKAQGPGWWLGPVQGLRCGSLLVEAPRCVLLLPAMRTGAWP
jgi:hypothetical protein